MSFFAAGSAIAGALGAGAVGSAVAGAGAAYLGNKLVNKSTSGSSSGSVGQLPNNPLDIDKIISDARLAAAQNYKNSLALEAAQNPGQAAFRNAATQGITDLANAGPYLAAIPGRSGSYNAPAARTYTGQPLQAYTGSEQGNSLLSESADSILQSLRLGGELPADVRSQIARTALQKSGQAGISGSGAARGLVARDIGRTSLDLLTARQQQAMQAGGLLEQIGLGRAQFGLDQSRFGLDVDRFGLQADQFGLDQARFGLEGDRFGLEAAQLGLAQEQFNTNRALQLKSLADAYGLPESGLSSGAIASLYVGENNALNQTNQNQFLIN
jgi:hypothetical protein